MKKTLCILGLLLITTTFFGQNIIRLPFEKPAIVTWENDEKAYYSEIWKTPVVTNVSVPTMEIFTPKPGTSNGVAVIIAPGGGLYALSMETEGNMVAKWLNEKGITAFVLKYRLVPTGEDGVGELTRLSDEDPDKIHEEVSEVMPFSVADGLNAVSWVRENAPRFQIDTNKIGFMGFSAGGSVTMGVAYNYEQTNRPDFIVPVYAWTDEMPVQKPKKDAPPMLVICAADDPLGLASGSVDLFTSWNKEGLSAGLHMFSKGGHGYGMRKQGLPFDNWIVRFYEWALAQGIVTAESN
jgi:dienelactone hydrolase